jgi:hypothetical protein
MRMIPAAVLTVMSPKPEMLTVPELNEASEAMMRCTPGWTDCAATLRSMRCPVLELTVIPPPTPVSVTVPEV